MILDLKIRRCLLFDWGDTLMRVFPEYEGPMACWPRIELIPYVERILKQLHSSWIIGLATNAQDSDESEIRKALDLGGISPLIDEIYCFRRIGVKKPSAAFFESILEDLKLERTQLVFVGDSYETDIIGAGKAGIRAVWLNHHASDELRRDEMTIHNLLELPDILDRMGTIADTSKKDQTFRRDK